MKPMWYDSSRWSFLGCSGGARKPRAPSLGASARRRAEHARRASSRARSRLRREESDARARDERTSDGSHALETNLRIVPGGRSTTEVPLEGECGRTPR